MIIQDLFESPQLCPECGGISFSDLILAEKKDACYHKVKASAKVWPSAYASGRLVQCRKKGAANYGKSKTEGVAEDFTDDVENIYAMHPQPEKSEKIAFLILDKDEIEFATDWRELPDPYQQEFGYDLPLWDADDFGSYPNLVVKRITFDQYVNLVGNYIESEELAGSAMSKMKRGVAEGSLNEFAPSGGEGNGPFDYGRAIVEIGQEFVDYYQDEGAQADAKAIIKVGQTFISAGMKAGIQAFYNLDTQIRDHVAEQLMEQGFNVKQDIYLPYRQQMAKAAADDAAEREKYTSSPEYAARRADDLTISAIPDKPINSWSKPGDPAASVTMDRASKRNIKAEFEKFKQDLARRDSLKGVPLRFEITVGGKPVDINSLREQGVAEGLSWSTLDEGLSLDDKMAIFEEYAIRGNLTESIDQDKKDYFISLFELSNAPVKNKKYIVAPLVLVGNRVMPLDKPAIMRFLAQDHDVLVFDTVNGKKTYPSKTLRDLSVFNTFTFASHSAYDKFRAALSLKFDIGLPSIAQEQGVAEGAESQYIAARYIDEFGDGDHWYVKGNPDVIKKFVLLANSLEDEAVKGTEYEPDKGMMAKVHGQLGDDSIPQWQIVQAQNLEQLKPIGNRVLQLLMQPDLSHSTQEFMSEFLWTLEEKGLALVTGEPEQGVAESYEPGDKITWYHSNHYPKIEGTVVGWKDGHLIVQSVDPSPRNTEKTVTKYRVPKNNIMSVEKQGVAEAGPFSYGKPPRKGSVADLAAKKRKEQERGQQPIEPKDQQVGVAKVTKGVAEYAALAEEFDLIESTVQRLAKHNNVDAELIWEDLESLSDDELYVFAVTMPLTEDWQKANKQDRTDGMSRKAVKAYRREHPGSKLKTAVTTKPSKLKRGSKASKRRKSYCSRSRGQMKMHSISCAKTPDKAICKARRRWNCE